MIIDAIVLAGGRSSRLGGRSKLALIVDGRTLLERTLGALSMVRQTVLVGDDAEISEAAPTETAMIVRESPPFSGPAAAIVAGIAAQSGRADFVIVLACDMPGIARAIPVLVAAVALHPEGVVAMSSDGRIQQLAGIYPDAGLRRCAARIDLEGLSVRALLADLQPFPVEVPIGSTDDIDTWADFALLTDMTDKELR